MSTINSLNKILSKFECTEIIHKICSDCELIDYEILPADSQVIGYLGEYFKVYLKYATKNEIKSQTLFMKTLPLNNEEQTEMIKTLGFMRKEQTLYTTLFEDLNKYAARKWHPDVFLGRDDILILEDLQLSGYGLFDSNFDFPTSYIKSVLECLAAMHANSIVYEAKSGLNIETKFQNCLFEISWVRNNSWISTGLMAIIKLASVHPKFQSIDHQTFISTKLQGKLEKIYDLKGPSSRFQNTLCHRDLWAKNLLFKNEGNRIDCLFVDFQIAAYMPPAIDVLFFLYLNASKSNRNRHMAEYLNYYYDCLIKFTHQKQVPLDRHLTRDDFDKSCNEYRLAPFILCAIYGPAIFLPDDFFQKIQRRDPMQFHQLMQVDRSNLLVECLGKYEKYRIRMLDTIEELIDYLYECEN